MKKFASYILLAAMMLSILTGCGGGQANKSEQEGATKTGTIKFTISTDGAIRSTYVDRFVELVEEASGGKYKGNVYAQSSIGSAADMAQMIQLGTLDFCLNDDMSIDGILDGALGFAWLPGLVADYEEADKYYNHGWIGEQVANIMEQNNMIRISSFCNGFRQVGNLKHEITEMSDLRGLKIRTPAVPSIVSFYEKCGAMPVMISTSEVLSALQTGTVDGLDNAIFNYIVQGLTDVITYITELNYCYSGGCFISSPTFWNKLSDEDQAMFKECAQKASDEFTEYFRKTTADLLQEGIDKGQWVVSQPSDAMKAELKGIYEQIWEESRNEYPAEIMDAIISGSYKD
ncbi:TRAP transporter substrate-binding protein [Dysosmobacter welbionis]|jgi:TRAP dicarboxylate transporter, dctP subunit|uniref:TRAP transporter substrate-binding protein n=1 Tax=Dysosmobacter welbionis TaxID=2093857 RepID=UPI00210AFDEE|nr:TRAP transporter substrate-binding protein DctP [Dysosmobacter welbionis]MCQ5045980.1 TRAP transporter substrate-binding protein DctP [Dysosmobacter welbionis]